MIIAKADIDETLAGIADDAIEMAARLVEKLGALETMRGMSVPRFAAQAASDIRLLKSNALS